MNLFLLSGSQRFPPSLTCSIQRPCLFLYLFLFLFVITPCVLTFDASSSVKMPTFTSEERALLRKTFLRKFGLSHLDGQRIGNSIPKVPDYIWNLYNRVQQRRAEFTTLRHYSTYSLQFVGNGCAWLTFNLSTGGKQPENASSY